jgi:hypothetical protein
MITLIGPLGKVCARNPLGIIAVPAADAERANINLREIFVMAPPLLFAEREASA